ncbi:MAG: reverse transcriptase domain-containing protein [Rhodoferax sp.]|nr:reverse transcriptase domain-containing protein [Rhodoferax sp.]
MPAPTLPSVRQWNTFFITRGIDEATAKAYLAYIRPLLKNRVPVIFDREHLAKLLGRTEHYLAAASFAPEFFYRDFTIPKRAGGKREIRAPYVSLLECQRWINDNILSAMVPHACATGYVIGRSIRDHASPHVNADFVLTIDLENFFPSIKFSRVLSIFRGLGYSAQVSSSLAKLCCLDNALPQGAPTSPSLSNIVCRRLDEKLEDMSSEVGLRYTRYADDMCFSGAAIRKITLSKVEKIVCSEGFRIKKAKTHLHTPQSNLKLVTGINVALGKLSLPKPYKRAISTDLYHIEKHGLRSHLAKKKIRDPSYLETLLGKVGYWLFIEPENSHAQHYQRVLKRFIDP